jgi:hypothetical protein
MIPFEVMKAVNAAYVDFTISDLSPKTIVVRVRNALIHLNYPITHLVISKDVMSQIVSEDWWSQSMDPVTQVETTAGVIGTLYGMTVCSDFVGNVPKESVLEPKTLAAVVVHPKLVINKVRYLPIATRP